MARDANAGSSGGNNQEAVLRALQPGLCLTVEALARATGLGHRAVVNAAGALIAKGYAERAEVGCFLITGDGDAFRASGAAITSGPNGPLAQVAARRPARDTLRDRLWAAMRVAGKFSVPELLIYARTNGPLEQDPEGNAQRYVRALARAGYLRALPRREAGTAPTSNGFKRYALIRDSGHRTPVVQVRKRVVWDPNDATAYPLDRRATSAEVTP